MLTINSIKAFALKSASLTKVAIETMDNEECFIKQFSIADTMEFRGMTEEDIAYTMVAIGVVDEDGKRLFDDIETIKSLPVSVVTEFIEHVQSHNAMADVESQAKK